MSHKAFEVTVSGVTFKNLTIKSAVAGSDGGAIYFSHDGTVSNCTFIGNSATSCYGGAIYMSTGTVTNCNFIDNEVSEGRGGAIYMCGGTVLNCNFIGNEALPRGGAIYMCGGIVSNCNFTNNEAALVYGPAGKGGAIYMCGGTVLNCNFIGNRATKAYGGAIYVDSSGSNIIGCIFTKNHANYKGGAIYLNSRNNVIDMCVFDSNSADEDGGAIYVEARYNTIKNSSFVHNYVKDEGGAVYINGMYGKIYSSNFISNNARTGYDIYCDSGYCGLYTSSLLGNTPENAVYSSKSFSAVKNWWGNTDQNKNEKPKVQGNVVVDDWYYLSFNNTYYMPIGKTPIELSLKSATDDSQRDIPSFHAIHNVKATNAIATRADKYTLYYEPSPNSDKGSVELTLTNYWTYDSSFEFNFIHEVNSVTVHNYDELADALENSQKQLSLKYIIDLAEGDYTATRSVLLRESAGLKNLIINGNNNVLDGKDSYTFLNIWDWQVQ